MYKIAILPILKQSQLVLIQDEACYDVYEHHHKNIWEILIFFTTVIR